MTIATLYTIDRSLNLIWRADRHRPLLRSVAGYTLLLVTGPVLLGASLWVTTWLVAVSRAEGAALGLVPLAVSTLGFFLTYRFIPNRHVPGAHALAGGLLAAVVFELTKLLFASWIRAVPTYRLVYGAFAAIPLFLLWLYLTWLVVLAGAEFTAALGYWRLRLWRQRDSLAERLRGALAVVRRLPPPGGVPVPITDLRAAIDMPGDRIEDVLHRLADAGVARRTRKGWCLLKPLTEVPLVVVYHAAQPGAVTLSPQEWSRCSPELGVIALSMEEALKRSVAELP
jgi:membrane protein